MRHVASDRFWRHYDRLPAQVQRLADKSFDLLRSDPGHPSLHFKKVGLFRSARVGLHHRVLAIEDRDALVWFWIGNHDEYDRLIG